MNTPGEQLIELVTTAQQDVILVAPFIKIGALRRVLGSIDDRVSVHCVTRWRPEEIAAGVSDLAVWDVLSERPRSSLWLQSHLHAKYYRADDQCLVGSANLTATALGWVQPPNLELLIAHPAAELEVFESVVFSRSREVTADLVHATQTLVDALRQEAAVELIDSASAIENDARPEIWIPALANPALFYECYTDTRQVHPDDWADGMNDLDYLRPPRGLSEQRFSHYIGWLLLQQPLIRDIDDMLIVPQRFGAVRQFLKATPYAQNERFDATRTWQILLDWLLYFLPQRYHRVPSRHSEVLART